MNHIKSFIDNDKKLTFIFIFLLYLNLIVIIRTLCKKYIGASDLEVLPGVIYFYPDTRKDLLWYIIGIPSSFLFFLSTLAYIRLCSEKIRLFFFCLKRSNYFYLYTTATIVSIAIAPIVLFKDKNFLLLTCAVWVLIYFAPIYYFYIPQLRSIVGKFICADRKLNKFYLLLLIGSALYLLFLLKPFLFNTIQVVNEFWDIPVQTKLSSGKIVNSTDFFNDNGLMGLSKKYDLNNPGESSPVCVALPYTQELKKYLEDVVSTNGSPPLAYDKITGQLCFLAPVSYETLSALDTVSGRVKTQELLNVNPRIKSARENWEKKLEEDRSSIAEFTERNFYGLLWSVLSRGFVHHHYHMMSPINELNLGRPITEIFFPYGILNAYFFQKVLSALGEVNYNGYMKALYSFHLLYFILILSAVWLTTKNLSMLVTSALFYVLSIHIITFQYFYMGPGITPFRRIFDFPVFMCFFLYLSKQRRIYYLAALSLCLVAIANNLEYGATLSVALGVTVFIKNLRRRFINFETISLVVACICAGVVIYLVMSMGSVRMATMFLSGVLSFKIKSYIIIYSLCIIFASYFLFLWLKKFDEAISYTFLLVMIYIQGLLVYWFRSYAFYHIAPSIPVIVFACILALSVFFKLYTNIGKLLVIGTIGIVILAVVKTLPAYYDFYERINQSMNANDTYEWNLPGTGFVSDMSPEYFEDSIALIHKYVPDNRGVHIISQYDTILPLMSEKYNLLPTIDLQNFLVTQDDMDRVVNTIKIEAPDYIFVDRHLPERNFSFDIIPYGGVLGGSHQESLWRAQRLKQMQKVFYEIEKNYKPIESSFLITVYERVDHGMYGR